MKKSEIKVGGCYIAKVSGRLTTVRVDEITTHAGIKRDEQRYHVTNLVTGRRTTFRSAAKFRCTAPKGAEGKTRPSLEAIEAATLALAEDEQRPDPTSKTTSTGGAIQTVPTTTLTSPAQSGTSATCPRCGQTVAVVSGAYDYHRKPSGITCGQSGEKMLTAAQQKAVAKYGQDAHCLKREGEQRQNPPKSGSGSAISAKEGEQSADPRTSAPTTSESCAPSVEQESFPPATPTSSVRLAGDGDCASTSPLTRLLSASIARELADRSPHVEVKALAGTGKTTTCIEGIGEAKGIGSALTPSDEQRAVWEAIKEGAHGTVRISSFAKKITDELERRCEDRGLHLLGVEAKGIHSLGLREATKRFGKLNANNAKWVVPDIVCGILGRDMKSLRGTPEAEMIWAVDSLVSLCKQTMSNPTPEELDALSSRFDIDLNGSRKQVYELVPQVLERCLTPKGGRITFDDMIWLPLKHNLPIPQVDLQIVDESQDLNRMQQELIYRSGRRILFVGDEHQAIYGFAGADAESMQRMRATLGAPDWDNANPSCKSKGAGRGCITLPLTVTRRCGRAIVMEARRSVPEYQAHESNPEGLVTSAGYEEGPRNYRQRAQAGDFVLCRVNAPLVSQCFRFIKAGRKALILGKKVGEGLTALIDKSKTSDVPSLISWLGDWLAKETANENAKRYPSEGRLENLQDRHDCILAFCEGESAVDGVKAKIAQVFTEDKDDRGITLSSIHKSKGLEAQRVFLLQPKGVGPRQDKMQPWELEQERNLRYVAITRAIEELIYVS